VAGGDRLASGVPVTEGGRSWPAVHRTLDDEMCGHEQPACKAPIAGRDVSPRSKSSLLGCLALVGLVLLAVALPALAAGHRGLRSTGNDPGARSAALRGSVLRLLNRQRARHGLRPLRRSGALDDAARWQSHDLVRYRYFAHERPGGPSLFKRIRKTGYLRGARSWTLGENIAWGQGSRSRPKSIVAAWMASPGHRANILSPAFREVGIGLSLGAPVRGRGMPAATYATDFGAARR
jgi:uncharacterized protein YkwD